MAGGHRRSSDGDRQGAQTVLAGAERAAPPGDPGGRGAGRCVWGAGRAPEVPVIAANGGGLQVEGVIDEDLRGSLGDGGRCVGQGVAGWWRRGTWEGPVHRWAVVDDWRAWLVPGQRWR